MDVNVPKAFSQQMVRFYELEDFFVSCQSCQGKKLYEGKDFTPVFHITTGELSHNIQVTHHLSIIQQPFKVGVTLSKVMYPH